MNYPSKGKENSAKFSAKFIVFIAVTLIAVFVNAPVSYADKEDYVDIQNSVCNSAVVDNGNNKTYLIYADKLTEIIGQSTPYKTAGNVFVDVSDDYKEDITNALVESIGKNFENANFSITERGNSTSPAKFGGYRILYSTQDGRVFADVSESGLIHNVVVHFVPANSVNYNAMGIVEGCINLSPEKSFNNVKDAMSAMSKYPNVNVYEAKNFRYGTEANSIVVLTEEEALKLQSYRPKMITDGSSDTITEGVHIVTWVYDSRVFEIPITWYEIYVGVPDNEIINNKNADQTSNSGTNADADKENLDNQTENDNHNESTEGSRIKEKNQINPVVLVFVLLLLGYVVYRFVYVIIKYKAIKTEDQQITYEDPYNDSEEDYIDVEYREIEDNSENSD